MKRSIGHDGAQEPQKALAIVEQCARISSAQARVLTVVEGGAQAVSIRLRNIANGKKLFWRNKISGMKSKSGCSSFMNPAGTGWPSIWAIPSYWRG
jgi:hypothetical protein